MKKAILMILLAALLATPLTGCDTADSDDEPAKTTTESKGKENGDNIPEYNAADANPASDFEYKLGENGGITITKYIGTDTDVVIPEKIDGKNVTVIGRDAFSNKQGYSVVSVLMPDTILLIDFSAFNKCEKLSTVRLSSKLEKINNAAFIDCSSLTHIRLPDTLSYIGVEAFKNCSSLQHINIPKSITEWHSYSFAFSGIKTIELEDGLTILGYSAFMSTLIEEISVPGSIKTITHGAFHNCDNLQTIRLTEGTEVIEDSAFSNSAMIEEIVIPSTVINCDERAFWNCESLQKVKFQGNAPIKFEIEDEFIKELYADTHPNYTIYYHEGATGFTSPEWKGYLTQIW